MTTTWSHRLPAPRPTVSPAETTGTAAATVAGIPAQGGPVEAPAVPASPADVLRAATYREFLYGFGTAPGVDLGRALRYENGETVKRQYFEHGLTVANLGDEPTVVALACEHTDADGNTVMHVVVPAHAAEVLRRI